MQHKKVTVVLPTLTKDDIDYEPTGEYRFIQPGEYFKGTNDGTFNDILQNKQSSPFEMQRFIYKRVNNLSIIDKVKKKLIAHCFIAMFRVAGVSTFEGLQNQLNHYCPGEFNLEEIIKNIPNKYKTQE